MWTTCLITLIAAIGLSWAERGWLVERKIPEPTPFGIVLGFSAAMLLGSMDSLRLAIRNRRNTGSDMAKWEPGTIVRTSGLVQSRGGILKTPIRQQPAVAFTYLWTPSNDEERYGGVSGMDMGELELLTPGGRVRLEGFPSLEHFPASVTKGKAGHEAAAEWLTKRKWVFEDLYFNGPQKRQQVALTLMKQELKLPLDIIAESLHRELLEDGNDPEEVRSRLKGKKWEFEERAIPNGMEVTVKGRFETNPPRIRVQSTMFDLDVEVKPGEAKGVSRQELKQALWGIFNSGLVAAALHWDAYYNNAGLYRRLLSFLASAE